MEVGEDRSEYLRDTKVKKGLLITDPPGPGLSRTELGAELVPPGATGKPSDNNLSSVISVTATSGSGLS